MKVSNRLYNKLLRENAIYLNGNIYNTHASYRTCIKENDMITINLDYKEDNLNIIPQKMNLDIVYEDEWLLVLNKPAGIPVHPSLMHYENSLSNGVRYYFDLIGLKKKIRPVNRLDKDTSGLVVFAKCEYIHSVLMDEMQNNLFTKKYLAITTGIFQNKYGIIDLPIARKKDSIIERYINFNGQNALTKYIVLKENTELNLSLVECELLTR